MHCTRRVHERGLKPKIAERKDINRIIDSPEKKLSLQEKQLLWKYRFSLVDNKRALTKFLRVVDWGDGGESRQAVQLMKEWTPIDIADALELLSKFFTNTSVRSYAVTQLDRANNEELNNYLLQLVQAIRYEEKYPSVLSKFLIRRCSDDFFLANFFNWFLCVERHDKTRGQTYSRFLSDFFKVLFDKHPGWVKRLQVGVIVIVCVQYLSL